jgi:proteasome accessory factor C
VTSARTAQRLSRILSMLPWVIAHPGASVEEVSSRFGYQGDELVKDLNLVFVCGLPGYGPGDLMDAYLDEDEVVVDMADYFSRPLKLSAPEALMMLAGGMAMLSSGAHHPALESAVDKLSRAVLPEPGLVAVDLGPEPGFVAALRGAAAEQRVVDIEYTALASGETTERSIEPWAVFASLGNWYVSGRCRLAEGERLFRIDRIKGLEVTGEAFDPPDGPVEPRVRYSPGVEDAVVRLRLEPTAAWVADYYPVEIVSSAEDGALEVDFSTSDVAVIARLLVRLGNGAQIVGGPDAAAASEAVSDLRGRILTRYE